MVRDIAALHGINLQLDKQSTSGQTLPQMLRKAYQQERAASGYKCTTERTGGSGGTHKGSLQNPVHLGSPQ